MSDNVEIDTPMGVIRSTSGALAEAMAQLLADVGGTERDLVDVMALSLHDATLDVTGPAARDAA